ARVAAVAAGADDLVEEAEGGLHVAGLRGHDAGGVADGHPSGGGGAPLAPGDELSEAAVAFAEVAADDPEPPQRLPQLERGLEVVPAFEVGEGGAAVGLLGVEAVQPAGLIEAGEVGLGLAGEGEEEAGVRLAGGLGLARGVERVEAELADGLEHAEARLAGGLAPPALVAAEEAVVEEGEDALLGVRVGVPGDGRGGLERAP